MSDRILPAITRLLDEFGKRTAVFDWNLVDMVQDARVELEAYKRKSRLLHRLTAKQRQREALNARRPKSV